MELSAEPIFSALKQWPNTVIVPLLHLWTLLEDNAVEGRACPGWAVSQRLSWQGGSVPFPSPSWCEPCAGSAEPCPLHHGLSTQVPADIPNSAPIEELPNGEKHEEHHSFPSCSAMPLVITLACFHPAQQWGVFDLWLGYLTAFPRWKVQLS